MRKATLIRTATLSVTLAVSAEIVRATPSLTTLVSFNGTNGGNPFTNLIFDGAGDLFGTTTQTSVGGTGGTVFELPASNLSSLTTVATFNRSNGWKPQGSISIDSSGDIFGTTNVGGPASAGVVFAANAANGSITDLTYFSGANGTYPDGGLVSDGSGYLYGTTSGGGGNGGGTVFKIPSNGSFTETTLARLSAGSAPTGKLVFDSSGNIFGTTSGTGTGGSGTVFEIPIATGLPVTLATFNGSNGAQPGDLISDSAGNLYGATRSGGQYGYGAIYEIQASNPSSIDTLASFNGSNGETPVTGLIRDSAGDLFGVTTSGGSSNIFGAPTGVGTVYELPAGTGTITDLTAFNTSNGANPQAALTADGAGNLYGTTFGGGNYSEGTVFEITNSGFVTSAPQTITVLNGQVYHFNASTGSGIWVRTIGGLTIEAGGTAIVDPASSHSNRQLLVISSLSIAGGTDAWTGAFDVSNNDLDLPGASLATITNQIKQGSNSGKWNGPNGISSASAAGDSTHLTALGVIQNNQSGSAIYNSSNQFAGTTPGASDILVKYTYYGDANLDGKVDGSDYSLIDSGFLNLRTGWFNGDFNYDGVVNGSDYTLIDNAFNRQAASLAGTIAAPLANVTAQVALTNAVPEPGLITGIGMIGIASLRRGKRRYNGEP